MVNESQPCPRDVFIDASVFRAINFNYSNPALETLAGLTADGGLQVYFTDISIEETKSLLLNTIDKAASTVTSIHKKARTNISVLQNIGDDRFRNLFEQLDPDPIKSELLGQLEIFIKDANAEIISTEKVFVKTVFDQYFTRKPPFGDGKKKSEFPDAFTLGALKNLSISKGVPIAIIAKDNDLKLACDDEPEFVYFEKIDAYIECLLIEVVEKVIKNVNEAVEADIENIESLIGKEFEGLGFFLDDEWGEVEEVIVNRVEILEHNVVKLPTDKVQLSIIASIDFTAEVMYDDMNTASYDSEDKVLIPHQTIQDTLDRTIDADIDLTIDMPSNMSVAVQNIVINGESDIKITVDTDYPYK